MLLTLTGINAFAAHTRVYVSGITVVGASNRDDIGVTLQSLLSSRLNSDTFTAVTSGAEADVLLTGTFATIGKVYSIDVIAKGVDESFLARAYVQGENQDHLIPLIGTLAEKLTADLLKIKAEGKLQVITKVRKSTESSHILRPMKQEEGGDIIRQESRMTRTGGAREKGWVSRKLLGAANIMAIGTTLSDGSREIFLAQDNKVQYFRQGGDMKLMDTVDFMANEKVLSVDAIDSDGDGKQELYITVIKSGELASQIWEVRGDRLGRITTDIPLYFRAMSLGGLASKLYVQEMSSNDDYYGPLYEASRIGGSIAKENPIRMPRYANIYNYNQFKAKDENQFSIAFAQDKCLVVYDNKLKEVWRSSDKFGGTNLYFERDDQNNARVTGQKYRSVYPQMRIHVTTRNEVIVGKNDGTFVVGNSGLYKKGAVYAFEWDGSGLDELWRTREVQNYMPDYRFDEARGELLILQMPLKPGPFEDGAALIAIKKVE